MNETPESPAPRTQARLWRWAAGLGVLATAVFAAVLVHEKIIVPRREPAPVPEARRRFGRLPLTRQRDDWKDLPDAIRGRIDENALPPLDRNPGRLAPPPKAVRLAAYRRDVPGGVQEYARYELADTLERGAAHYAGLLLNEGFECHNNSRAAGGRARLHFIKGPTHALVTLRTYAKDATITLITVILMTDRDAGGAADGR